MSEEDGFEIAGYVAFMSFFAFFPFLIFLAALAGFVGEPESVPVIVDLMFSFMPPEVATVLSPAVAEVITLRTTGLLTFGVLATLWTASSGIESLRVALNRAYGIRRPRALWRRRLQSLVFVIVGAFALLLLSVSVLLGPLIWQWIAPAAEYLGREQVLWTVARLAVAVLVLVASLMMLHIFLPNIRLRTRAILPGVTVTAMAWLALGSAFSIYLAYFGDYPMTYGSLGGIVLTLVFLYASGLLFIYGAYLNAALLAIRPIQIADHAE